MFWPGSQRFVRALPRCGMPFPTAVSGLGSQGLVRTLPRAWCGLSLRGEWPRQPEAWRPLHGCAAPFPSVASSPGSQRLGSFSPGMMRLFPPRPQRAPPVRSQEVFRQEPGPVCSVGGGGFSGAEFAPFPSPASYLRWGWGGSSLEILSPFVLRTASSVFQPVNFSSLSHSLKKAPSYCSQGLLAGPYPKQCHRLLSVPPHLAGGGGGHLGYFSAGSCF